jgi:hypothetical protein
MLASLAMLAPSRTSDCADFERAEAENWRCDPNHIIAPACTRNVICDTCDDAHSHSCFSLRNFGHINWQISGVTHGLYADLRFAGAAM